MQSLSRLSLILVLGTIPNLSFAMTPEASAVISDSGKSFKLTITNPHDQELVCSLKAEVSAAEGDCTNPQFILKDSWNGVPIKANGTVVDNQFGLEILARLKKTKTVFCSNPEFTFNCSPAKKKG